MALSCELTGEFHKERCMCMCVDTCVYMGVYGQVCAFEWASVSVDKCACVCVCAYVFVHVDRCVFMFVCVPASVHMCECIHVPVHSVCVCRQDACL